MLLFPDKIAKIPARFILQNKVPGNNFQKRIGGHYLTQVSEVGEPVCKHGIGLNITIENQPDRIIDPDPVTIIKITNKPVKKFFEFLGCIF